MKKDLNTRINDIVLRYFAKNSDLEKVPAKDLMPEFIEAGIFPKDQRNGQPIRNVLRELDENNKLDAIPAVYPDRKEVNTNWFFLNLSSKAPADSAGLKQPKPKLNWNKIKRNFPKHNLENYNYWFGDFRTLLDIPNDVQFVSLKFMKKQFDEIKLLDDGRLSIHKATREKLVELGKDLENLEEVEIQIGFVDRGYAISSLKFESVFESFKKYVKHLSGKEFTGFTVGWMHEQEAYKSEIREHALKTLKVSSWKEDSMGNGDILRSVIAAIEVKENNLLEIHDKRGPDTANHAKLRNALESAEATARIEGILYAFFNSNDQDQDLFNQLKAEIGGIYALLAYLFFLKNDEQYLPISTSNFENAFSLLGVDIRLQRQAGWSNYQQYLDLVHQTKDLIEDKLELSIKLIDAHSFLWKIGYHGAFAEWLTDKPVTATRTIRETVITPTNSRPTEPPLPQTGLLPVREIDWDEKGRRRRISGRKAEEIVFTHEKQKLLDEGLTDLASRVDDYSNRLGMGYDILSFDPDGTEKHIEVKSTNSNSFMISGNELAISKVDPHYFIYLVIQRANEIEIRVIPGPDLEDPAQFSLRPKDFYVSFDN